MDTNKNLYSEYKLMNHLDRLFTWAKGEISYPVLVDFDLSNKCNNRCPLCNGSRNRDSTTVELNDAEKIISQLKEADVKAIGLGGGGESTCNPNLEEILRIINKNNIESAIYTNCYELSRGVIDAIVDYCTWARISLDADGPEIYKKSHGMGSKAFFRVIENISRIVETRERNNSDIIIGTCYLVGPHTIKGVYNATRLSKELGVDYIRFRPFLNLRNKRSFTSENGKEMLKELEMCKEFEDSNFSVTYPYNRCEYESTIGVRKRNYDKCYFPNFFTSITANLKLYPCCALKGNEKYCFGDLKKSSFKEIWTSEKRKEINNKIDLENCPNPCQFENHVELLFSIKNPVFHSNFL